MKGKVTSAAKIYELEPWVDREISKLSRDRQTMVLRFLEELRILNASRWTIEGYVQAIRTLGHDGKHYKKLTRSDLVQWMTALDTNGYSEHTVNTFRRRVKRFLRWVHGCDGRGSPTPKPLKCIRIKRMRRELPKEILSKAEVRKLVDTCGNQRDRTLIFVAYESGTRPGELLSLPVRDVEFDRYGAILHVDGKTGMRRVRIVEAVPDLQIWLSMHPSRGDLDSALWPSQVSGKRAMTTAAFEWVLKETRRKANINKHVYPYLLRHTRATHLANVFTEAQMREFFGWTKDSDMPSNYVHLSGRDIDSTLLKHHGITTGQELEKPADLAPKRCYRCLNENPASAVYCMRCSMPLTTEAAIQSDEIVAQVIDELIKRAPKTLEKALKASGAMNQLASIAAEGSKE